MIIGITGLAGAGKDSFALALQRALVAAGVPCVMDSFAAPIRAIAADCRFSMERDRKERLGWFDSDLLDERLFDSMQRHMQFITEDERAQVYGHMLEALDGCRDGVDYCLSPRQFMQWLGTEAGRRVRDDLWVARLRDVHAQDVVVLITDTRFDNEVPVCDGIANVIRPDLAIPTYHVSEALALSLLNGWQDSLPPAVPVHHIVNAHDLAFLGEQAVAFADHIAARRKPPAS